MIFEDDLCYIGTSGGWKDVSSNYTSRVIQESSENWERPIMSGRSPLTLGSEQAMTSVITSRTT